MPEPDEPQRGRLASWLEQRVEQLLARRRLATRSSGRYRELQTVGHDRIPWEIRPAPSRIVAVGDLHGDAAGLGSILHARRLVDEEGSWSGSAAHLVLDGDLIGGKHSRLLLAMVIRLEQEARDAGGAVHAVLGNHDLAAMRRKRSKGKESRLFRKYPVDGARSLPTALRTETSWARWLRGRNAILKIGPTIFVHAGLNEWAAEHHPERVNASVRAWIRHWQGLDAEPNAGTRWTVERPDVDWEPPSSGPLWTRSFKTLRNFVELPDRAPRPEVLADILKTHNAARVVVGHAPVRGNRILLDHPVYATQVVMIDTRISEPKRGRLSCLEINDESLTAHYAKRSQTGKRIRKREENRLASQR